MCCGFPCGSFTYGLIKKKCNFVFCNETTWK